MRACSGSIVHIYNFYNIGIHMLKTIINTIGNFWAGTKLEELQQIALYARRKGDLSVHAGASAQRDARLFDAARALRSRSSLLLAMVNPGQYLSNREASKAEASYGEVIGPLLYVLTWRAPIYSAPACRAALKRLIEGSARSMDGHEFAQRALLEWLSFFENLIAQWGAGQLDMPLLTAPDPAEARKYRGAVYYDEQVVSSNMFDLAMRASFYARKIAELTKTLDSSGVQPPAQSLRAALIAVERELNSRQAVTIRQIVFCFHQAYASASAFWKLEQSQKLLPQTVADVKRARAELAIAMQKACSNVRLAHQAELEQIERVRQLFSVASSLSAV